MTTPLVTVITPAYNIEDYLGEAADAVLAQTERDFEYLIVDDGSSDRTAEIAQSYADQDDRVRLLRLLGSANGSSAVRNAALREARGSYIAFCDGDDRWQPTFLQKSLATLQDAPDNIGATFCSCRYIDQHGRLWGKIQGAKPGDYDAERNLAGHCPQGNGSSLLLRKACFDEAGLFDEDLYNCVDLDMWLRINLVEPPSTICFTSAYCSGANSPVHEWFVDVTKQWSRRLEIYAQPHFEIETIINTRIAKAGLRIVEVPSYEFERIHGESNLNTWRDGFRVLRALLTERATRPHTPSLHPSHPLEDLTAPPCQQPSIA